MRALALAALFSLAACSPQDSPAPTTSTFALSEVVKAELAALDSELELPELAGGENAELSEEVNGLITFLSGASGNLRESAILDLLSIGDEAVPILAAALGAGASTDDRCIAAIELLGALDSVRSSAQLLHGVETGREGWIRAHCAWRLGQGTQEWIIPRLVHRLRYETDGECVIWIAVALAHFGNYSGLVGLRELRNNGVTEAIRASAARELAALALPFDRDELEKLGGADDGVGLSWAWNTPGSTSFEAPTPSSARYRREIWRLIDDLDAFQLRGVDDARFVLSRLGTTAALCLAQALHDSSPHTRVHSAQALHRMGARGHVAGPELVRALDDEELAPTAAEALGRVGHPDASAALEARLDARHPLGLRVASARALGFIGLASSVDALRPLLADSNAFDLRQAAAESMVYCGVGEETARLLCELIESKRVDPASSVAALGWWLNQSARRNEPGTSAALEEWNVLYVPAGTVAPLEEVEERNRARVAIIRALLP